MLRRKSKRIKIGKVFIGSNEDILVQSMLNKPSSDFESNVLQAKSLEKKGCQILRVAIPDYNSVGLIEKLKSSVNIPIVADIHFDYKMAIESVNAGADKIRINPGNLDKSNLEKVVKECKQKEIPIRIGINSGSVEKKFLGSDIKIPDSMVKSALSTIEFLESLDFDKIVVSVKSSNVCESIDCYEKISKICDYPLHVGITESGAGMYGVVKSSVGIGSILSKGIGDTIRVSLTDDPLKEVETGFQILKSLGLANKVEVISCPTCGRTTVDVKFLAESVEKMTENINKKMKIAVMGCPVNGVGESKNADFGITGANGIGIIFRHGQILKKVSENLLLKELENLILEFKGE